MHHRLLPRVHEFRHPAVSQRRPISEGPDEIPQVAVCVTIRANCEIKLTAECVVLDVICLTVAVCRQLSKKKGVFRRGDPRSCFFQTSIIKKCEGRLAHVAKR